MNEFRIETGKALELRSNYALLQTAEEALDKVSEHRRNGLLDGIATLADHIACAVRAELPENKQRHALDPALSVIRHARSLEKNWDDAETREQLKWQVARLSTTISEFDEDEDEEQFEGHSRMIN